MAETSNQQTTTTGTQDPATPPTGNDQPTNWGTSRVDGRDGPIAPTSAENRLLNFYVAVGYCEQINKTTNEVRPKLLTAGFLSRSGDEAKGMMLTYLESTYSRDLYVNHAVIVSSIPDHLPIEACKHMGFQLFNADYKVIDAPIPALPAPMELKDWNKNGLIDTADKTIHSKWFKQLSTTSELDGIPEEFVGDFLDWQLRVAEWRVAILTAQKLKSI